METLALLLVLFIWLSYAIVCLASIGVLLFFIWLVLCGPREYTEKDTPTERKKKWRT